MTLLGVGLAVSMCAAAIAPAARSTEPVATVALWPGIAPGDAGDIGKEHDTSKSDPNVPASQYIVRLTNVARPTITVYRSPASQDTGAAVVVCPGGGYAILAMNLEGTEVCSWLNSIGVTAILLKYRVPARQARPQYAAPLQDAQRAMSIARHRAKEWGYDPNRLGILGFSAGGHLSAATCTNFDKRTYTALDDADQESIRPDFAILIYPAYLTSPDGGDRLADEIHVTAQTPPTFITMTEDDPVHVENAIVYALALKRAKVPVELHVFPIGGHGYGLRPSLNAVSHWPARAAAWLESQGWLKPKP